MEKRAISTEEKDKPEGLPFEFLEAQDGSLLPDRIEMRRRRKRKKNNRPDCLVPLLGCNVI